MTKEEYDQFVKDFAVLRQEEAEAEPVRPEPRLTREMYNDVIDEIVRPEPQSHSPMMVGYVPPKEVG